jgi:hypothetical protein
VQVEEMRGGAKEERQKGEGGFNVVVVVHGFSSFLFSVRQLCRTLFDFCGFYLLILVFT